MAINRISGISATGPAGYNVPKRGKIKFYSPQLWTKPPLVGYFPWLSYGTGYIDYAPNSNLSSVLTANGYIVLESGG